MVLFMHLKAAEMSKRRPTHPTFVWLFPTVYPLMTPQILLTIKLCPACLTLKRLGIGMDHHVTIQVPCAFERRATLFASVWLAIVVDQCVRLQIVRGFELGVAQLAREWFFGAVHAIMTPQVRFSLEHGATGFALKGPVIRVSYLVRF